MISRHLPLITNRIRFSSVAMAPLPIITSRVNLPLRRVDVPSANRSPEERELTPSEDGKEHYPENKSTRLDDGESELSELSELESEIDCDEPLRPAQKIPKPSGEPGRPNSGGYSIEDALISWGKDEFGKVMVSTPHSVSSNERQTLLQKFTKKLADAKLDQTISYGKQDHTKVNRLCETVFSSFLTVAISHSERIRSQEITQL